jgi:hypothetical protein
MLPISEAEKNTNELTEKISLVINSIDERRKELESLKRSNARLVEASLSRKRMPPSLRAQREQISRLIQEIEELAFVKQSLEAKLLKAQNDTVFAQLFQQAKIFTESEEIFFNRINDIAACMSDIAQRIETFKGKVEELKKSNHPLHLLIPILAEIRGKAAYQDFVMSGEVNAPAKTDNAYIDALISKYRKVRSDLPALEDLNRLGLILWNELGYISARATELRHFKHSS